MTYYTSHDTRDELLDVDKESSSTPSMPRRKPLQCPSQHALALHCPSSGLSLWLKKCRRGHRPPPTITTCSTFGEKGRGDKQGQNKKQEAAVAERLARSPPTKANRAQFLAGSPDFRKWESYRTMQLVGGFSQGSPISPAPSFRRRSIFNSITLIGSQDLAGLTLHHLTISPKPSDFFEKLKVPQMSLGRFVHRNGTPTAKSQSQHISEVVGEPRCRHELCMVGFHVERQYSLEPRAVAVFTGTLQFTVVLLLPRRNFKKRNKICKRKEHTGRGLGERSRHTATVDEWLSCSPLTKATPGSIPAGSPDSCMWRPYRTLPLVGRISRRSPVSPALSFRCRSILFSSPLSALKISL
ncbi:hypothetical protein PR048_019961 [Dryococelus australis]|uniref:Uncharacterized protein n=1 Tax=Dryococelus australis TaxID=614101 RepID=A0ABQ9H5B1_9NEOP|nr:hypothetical protein PR048_019961 [Dryococelus australis]